MIAEYGNLMSLVTPDLLQACNVEKLAIMGMTKSGKSLLTKEIAAQLNKPYAIGDDFLYLGHSGQQKKLEELMNQGVIVEGVTIPQMLLNASSKPDLVLNVTCSQECLEYCYWKDEEEHKWGKVKGFNSQIQSRIKKMYESGQFKIHTLSTTFKIPDDYNQCEIELF